VPDLSVTQQHHALEIVAFQPRTRRQLPRELLPLRRVEQGVQHQHRIKPNRLRVILDSVQEIFQHRRRSGARRAESVMVSQSHKWLFVLVILCATARA